MLGTRVGALACCNGEEDDGPICSSTPRPTSAPKQSRKEFRFGWPVINKPSLPGDPLGVDEEPGNLLMSPLATTRPLSGGLLGIGIGGGGGGGGGARLSSGGGGAVMSRGMGGGGGRGNSDSAELSRLSRDCTIIGGGGGGGGGGLFTGGAAGLTITDEMYGGFGG